MFERFTSDARDAVRGAVEEAERAGSAVVTEEYLALSLMEQGALDPYGVERAALRAALAEARRRGGLSKADEEALAGLGIDVSEIVARIEEAHGEGVLAEAAARRRPGRVGSLFRRRRRGRGADDRARTFHRPFTAEAKKVLEQSLRIALGRRDNTIATRHLLLALLARPGAVADALAAQGITYTRAEGGAAA
ncbi:Clp protease N-terminal domain-containing protein [Streptomyces bambusae]|uniref:Peptidase n=1 Tax=Streptomyces bambusae TaxID=1550616 RepID=A0ABS6ZGU3_9ACTN|nr:Clp protease N-terminal domain-containing protein [Streptomyces bambusae]MBW5486972.1 peptidase [Streptomyces bambusae]